MSADAGVPLTVVVTGATAGLGYWASEQLAAAGHRVVLAARNPERAAAAIESIRSVVRGPRSSTSRSTWPTWTPSAPRRPHSQTGCPTASMPS